jgi:hypothetical protein
MTYECILAPLLYPLAEVYAEHPQRTFVYNNHVYWCVGTHTTPQGTSYVVKAVDTDAPPIRLLGAIPVRPIEGWRLRDVAQMLA